MINIIAAEVKSFGILIMKKLGVIIERVEMNKEVKIIDLDDQNQFSSAFT